VDKVGSQRRRSQRWEKGKKAPGRRETEEKGKWSSPKDLCVNLENCRDLSVKHKFHINLKP
jgi:hypothetical protein